MEKILEQLNTISTEKQHLTKETESNESREQCHDQQDGKTVQYLRDLEDVCFHFDLNKSLFLSDPNGYVIDLQLAS